GLGAAGNTDLIPAALFVRGIWWWTIGKMWAETGVLPRPFGWITAALAIACFALVVAYSINEVPMSTPDLPLRVILGVWLVVVAVVLGFSALDEFRSVFSKATDPNSAGRAVLNMFSSPKDRLVSRSVCVGTEFPHAVGLALALKLRKEPYIVFAFGGDASTSTGDFHEAMNFAAVHKLPVVFVIENNLIAISTRIERQTAVK